MQIDLSMTLGDVIVAGAAVTSIMTAYYALKNQLRALPRIEERLTDHSEQLQEHEAAITELDVAVFGRGEQRAERRRRDRRRRETNARPQEG